jgi:hypothetical protein
VATVVKDTTLLRRTVTIVPLPQSN